MLRIEWADNTIGHDALTDHSLSAVVLWGSDFHLLWGLDWVTVHEEEGRGVRHLPILCIHN